MRAVLIERQGDPVAPNVRVVEDHPEPVPGPTDLVVATEAVGLNHLDLWVGRGVPGLPLEYPRVSGSDACGRVVGGGAATDPAWTGRRVIINAAVPQPSTARPGVTPGRDLRMIGEHDPGAMAERFVVPAANVLDVGDSDPVEAGCFGLAHLTAYRMLVTRAGLVPGQSVLITGIGGGVALAALNICRQLGCVTIVTSRSAEKLERALALGAHFGVHDEGEDWSKAVRAHTGGRGVDVCADSIGKAVHESCMKALAGGGTFVTCGCTSGPIATTSLARMFWLQLRLVGSTMGDMDEMRQVTAWFRQGAMRPTVDSVHAAADAAAAYARLESGQQFGKVVVRWG